MTYLRCRPSSSLVSVPYRLTSILFCLVAAWLTLVTQSAHAQGNATLAEALFDDGRRQFEAGNYEQACAKFKESQRLDPATGTLLNLAICYEKAGRLATAWSTWREAASSARAAGQSDREQHAREMADQLEGQLARLTIVVEGKDSLPAEFSLTQDGTKQPAAAWGVSLPVDAGTHHFQASAPGYLSWNEDFDVTDGATVSVHVPPLAVDPDAAASAPPEEPPQDQTATTAVEDTPPSPSNSPNVMKIVGISLMGAGGISSGVGTYFGIHALNKNKSSKTECNENDPNVCSRVGKSDRDTALSSANVANVLIGVGAAVATTGLVLFLVSGNDKRETALTVSPEYGGGHLLVSGAF